MEYLITESQYHYLKQVLSEQKVYTDKKKYKKAMDIYNVQKMFYDYLLQHYNVPMSFNEFLGIRIHDGMYDDANKAYFLSRSKDAKLRTNMQVILHHADHMAAMIEYDKVKTETNVTVTPINTSISKGHRLQKLESIANNPAAPATDKLSNMFDDLFGDK